MCPDDPQYWPQREPAPPPLKQESKFVHWLKRFGGPIGVAIIAGWKWIGIGAKALLPALQLLKLGKIATTMGSMLLSVWFYQLIFGWRFSVGFVLLIFVHEMGHVFVAWRQGIPITAPLFIPGMGAIILQKKEGDSAWAEALMAIGGPLAGTVGAIGCYGLYAATKDPLFLGLAYTGFFLNLFNMAPMFPLDGGWIVGSISPYLWIVGILMMVAGFATGFIRNPMIFILILLAIPRIWTGLRHGTPMGSPNLRPSTPEQKWIMGFAYIGLIAFLAWAMGETHVDEPHKKSGSQVASVISASNSSTALR